MPNILTAAVAMIHGRSARYAGVPLRDVLTQGGAPAGKALRGKALTRYVVVDAADGYRVIFSLAELDPAFTDRVVLIAGSRDGAAFSPREGSLRLIVPVKSARRDGFARLRPSMWRTQENYENQRAQSTRRDD